MEITPGSVNLMTAGRGITHSERTGAAERARPSKSLFGIQSWIALPDSAEDTDPEFEHRPEQSLPLIEAEGKKLRLILGAAYGERAPVKTFSEMFYADAMIDAGARLPLPDGHEDRAIYVLDGRIEIAGDQFEAGRMMVFRPGGRPGDLRRRRGRIHLPMRPVRRQPRADRHGRLEQFHDDLCGFRALRGRRRPRFVSPLPASPCRRRRRLRLPVPARSPSKIPQAFSKKARNSW